MREVLAVMGLMVLGWLFCMGVTYVIERIRDL